MKTEGQGEEGRHAQDTHDPETEGKHGDPWSQEPWASPAKGCIDQSEELGRMFCNCSLTVILRIGMLFVIL